MELLLAEPLPLGHAGNRLTQFVDSRDGGLDQVVTLCRVEDVRKLIGADNSRHDTLYYSSALASQPRDKFTRGRREVEEGVLRS